MRCRVVCGLSDTMASFSPMMRFRRDDLPAFGRPIRETNPAFILCRGGPPPRSAPLACGAPSPRAARGLSLSCVADFFSFVVLFARRACDADLADAAAL